MNEQTIFGFWSILMYCIRQHFRGNNSLKIQKHLKLTKLSGGILFLFPFLFGCLFILFYHEML